MTIKSLADENASVTNRINPGADVERFRHRFPRPLLEASLPPKVYYWNDIVGECRSLVFGVRLLDYTREGSQKASQKFEPPLLLQKAVAEIDRRGLEVEGIYRISGRAAVILDIIRRIERDESAFQFTPKDDVASIAGVIKQYLRQLPEPVFKVSLEDRLEYSKNRQEHINNGFSVIRGKIRRLAPIHHSTLRFLISHLTRSAILSR